MHCIALLPSADFESSEFGISFGNASKVRRSAKNTQLDYMRSTWTLRRLDNGRSVVAGGISDSVISDSTLSQQVG